MGRIAFTTRGMATAVSDGGLLLAPATDLWGDWGLLGVPDPDRATTTGQALLFRDFIRTAFPTFQFHRLSELLIELLQQVADGQLTRLIVCCPPRHGKSQLVSRLFPAYWVSRHPELFCAIASYSGELAYAHSREARHYYRSTGHALSKDSAAVGNWLTAQRGGCIAAGVRGPFTGKGYNLGIIDDPYKGPEDAKSALQRERLIDWLKSVWFTRAEPGLTAEGALLPAAQVVVQTRWDHHDMTAWLLEQEAEENPEHWTVLNLPAIAETEAISMPIPHTCTKVADWRQPGEPLCPERVLPFLGLCVPASRSIDGEPLGGELQELRYLTSAGYNKTASESRTFAMDIADDP
jgi:hypothetical protein